MPVSRVNLNVRELLYEDETYNILMDTAHQLYDEFENKLLESVLSGSTEYFSEEEQKRLIELSRIKLDNWDKKKPFLKFGEVGQHYANELFLSQPLNWGSRGTPFFWAYLARKFSNDKLPMSAEEFKIKYLREIQKAGIPYGIEKCIYMEQFAHGGMSSGMVSAMFITKALDILLKRLELYR